MTGRVDPILTKNIPFIRQLLIKTISTSNFKQTPVRDNMISGFVFLFTQPRILKQNLFHHRNKDSAIAGWSIY